MKLQVKREFEPVPRMIVQARYIFKFNDTDLESIELSMRNASGGTNYPSQFDKIEDVPPNEVPDDILREVSQTLMITAERIPVRNEE